MLKLGQENIKDASLVVISSEKKPQRLFAVFVPCLMIGALDRTVPPKQSIHALRSQLGIS